MLRRLDVVVRGAQVALKGPGSVAARLGHSWVGAEHLLLSLMSGQPDDDAARLLGTLGASLEATEQAISGMLTTSCPPAKSGGPRAIAPNPAWYEVVARAEGFAAFRHVGNPTSLDLLLAFVWDPMAGGMAKRALREQGVTREAIFAALAGTGSPMPIAPLPPEDPPWRNPRRVELPKEKLNDVVRRLRREYPPGRAPRWGVNSHEQLGWVVAEEGVEVERIVAEVLDQPS